MSIGYATTTTTTTTLIAGGCEPPPECSTTMVGGKVCFENDDYRITCGDDNTVHVFNKNTGEDYLVWGDPHVNVDGQHAFDFWGTTTFVLDDGTKITINTVPWAGNPDMTLASKVTITSGDYAVQVTGIDTNSTGDLAFEEAAGWGRLADLVVADGNTIYENPFGSGFLGLNGGQLQKVDQQYINRTDLQKGGALQERYAQAFLAMSGLMAIGFVGGFLAGALAATVLGGGDESARPNQYAMLMTRTTTTMSWFSVGGF